MAATEAWLPQSPKPPNLNTLNAVRVSLFYAFWCSLDFTCNSSDIVYIFRSRLIYYPSSQVLSLSLLPPVAPGSVPIVLYALSVFFSATERAARINKSHTGPLESRETDWNGLQGIKKTSGGGAGAFLMRRKCLTKRHYDKMITGVTPALHKFDLSWYNVVAKIKYKIFTPINCQWWNVTNTCTQVLYR